MAFADALHANGATVTLTADTGQFNAKIEAAERQWRDSVGNMSKEALKLDLAQDRLKKSLATYGAESAQAKRATIALRDAEEQAGRAASRTGAQLSANERGLGRLTRGAIAGSGAMRGLGRSLAFASSAFLGGAGLVYAIRTSISAAIEQDKILANLRNSLKASGFSWAQYGTQIQQATQRTKELSAFDDEELYASLQRLIRGTGSVTIALKANAVAADLARGANITLDQASKALLRAYNGQTAGLSRLGVQIEKGKKGTEALAAVQQKFAGASEAFSRSAAGAQARFTVGIQDMEKAIGRALLPTVTKYLGIASDWLNNTQNQARVQKDVTQIVQTGTQVVAGFAGALRTVKDVLGPIVNLLGGAENAAKTFFLAFAAYKIAKTVAAVRGLGIAFGFVGTSAVAASAEAVAAENAIGTAAVRNAGRVGILGRALQGLGGLAGLAGTAAAITGGVALGDLAAILASKGAQGGRTDKWKKYPLVAALVAKLDSGGKLTAREREVLSLLPRNASFSTLSDSQLAAVEKALGGGPRVQGMATPHGSAAAIRASQRGGTGGGGGGGGGGAPRRTEADIQLDIARASTTPGTADDLRYLRELDAYYKRQVAVLAARKHKSDQQKQALTQLYNEIASVESQIDSIVTANEKKIDDAHKAAQAKQARERKQRLEAAKRLQDQVDRANEAIARAQGSSRTNQILTDRGSSRTVKDIVRKQAAAASGMSQADLKKLFASMSYDFLTSLQGTLNTYGGNLFGAGELSVGGSAADSHAVLHTELLRRQNQILVDLSDKARMPGARYGYTNLTTAFDGYAS